MAIYKGTFGSGVIKNRVIIIGAGYGGIALANLLGKAGFSVEVYEKNNQIGGRILQIKKQGFTFDMGPSWYLMPEVFEHYYSLFGESAQKRLSLKRLSPAYRVFFENDQPVTISADLNIDSKVFDHIEPGAGAKLRQYIKQSTDIYDSSLKSFLYSNFNSPKLFLSRDVIKKSYSIIGKLPRSLDKYVSRYFSDLRLRQIMEYHSVFLGTSPFEAPAIYSLMSHLDFSSGVFYPAMGMLSMADDLKALGQNENIHYHTGSPVKSIISDNGIARGIELEDRSQKEADIVVSNADLHYTETKLLPIASRSFPASYWDTRQSGPSALTISLGIKGSLPDLLHHSLFFSDDWEDNFKSIYDDKKIPKQPSYYVCNPTKSDKSLAPKGHENLFVLVPLPSGVSLTEADIDSLSKFVLQDLGKKIKAKDLESRIVCKEVFGPDDFTSRYNAWQGNAFGGESHILKQSVFLRTRNKSKKLSNLYYVGAGTLPGIGLPMCLISAQLTYKNIMDIKHDRRLEPADINEIIQ